MKGLYAYIRVSTARQGAEGASLPEQRDSIQRYAERSGLSIIEWFEERETAAKSGRPVFARMMTRLKLGRASGVIIHKIDRSARNLGDWAKIGELIDQGVSVHFAHEPIDLQSTSGRFAADMQAVVAAHYVRNLREEVRKGLYGRLKQGIYPLRAPLGYIDQGGGKVKSIDPIRGPFVRQMFELYVNHGHSLRSLREEMNRRGLRSRSGKPLLLNTFNAVLRNPFYMGQMRIKANGLVFPGVHEPLISAALFARAQDILDGKRQPRIRTHDFLFRGLLECALCKRHLIGEAQKGHTYYRCHTRGCLNKCLREEIVDAVVRAHLASIAFHDEDHAALKAFIAKMRGEAASNQITLVKSLTLRRDEIDSRISRLTDAYVDRMIDEDIFRRRNGELQLERAQLSEQLHELHDDSACTVDASEALLQQLLNVLDRYGEATVAERREIIGAVATRLVVSQRDVSIEPNPHVAMLIEQRSRDGEHLFPDGLRDPKP